MSRVMVLGALHYDVVVAAPDLPRRDETLRGRGVEYRFGGKGGNQAVAAARMGADVAMIGRVGADAAGEVILAGLDAARVDRQAVEQGDAATGMSVAIALPDGDYGAVIVPGANAENNGHMRPLDMPGTALIQNEVPNAANLAFVRALPRGCRLIWNAAPAAPLHEDIARRTDILVVNRVEAGDLANGMAPEAAARALAGRVGGLAIVTLGAEGVIVSDGPKVSRHRGFAVDALSTHGAGDMFIGALAARLSQDAPIERAIDFAQAAASLFVRADAMAGSKITPAQVNELLANP